MTLSRSFTGTWKWCCQTLHTLYSTEDKARNGWGGESFSSRIPAGKLLEKLDAEGVQPHWVHAVSRQESLQGPSRQDFCYEKAISQTLGNVVVVTTWTQWCELTWSMFWHECLNTTPIHMNHGCAKGTSGRMMTTSSPVVTCLCSAVLKEPHLTWSFEETQRSRSLSCVSPIRVPLSCDGRCWEAHEVSRRTWIQAESKAQMSSKEASHPLPWPQFVFLLPLFFCTFPPSFSSGWASILQAQLGCPFLWSFLELGSWSRQPDALSTPFPCPPPVGSHIRLLSIHVPFPCSLVSFLPVTAKDSLNNFCHFSLTILIPFLPNQRVDTTFTKFVMKTSFPLNFWIPKAHFLLCFPVSWVLVRFSAGRFQLHVSWIWLPCCNFHSFPPSVLKCFTSQFILYPYLSHLLTCLLYSIFFFSFLFFSFCDGALLCSSGDPEIHYLDWPWAHIDLPVSAFPVLD